jgi:hypothetical protein
LTVAFKIGVYVWLGDKLQPQLAPVLPNDPAEVHLGILIYAHPNGVWKLHSLIGLDPCTSGGNFHDSTRNAHFLAWPHKAG